MNEFNLKEIRIRKLKKEDLKRAKEFQDYINALIREKAMILLDKERSLKEEKDWLVRKFKNVIKKKEVILIAEHLNKIVGISHVELGREKRSHVGEFGIPIRKEYRGVGLGKKLMKEIIKLAKKELKHHLKILRLSVFATNKIAQNLYKKLGFKKVAKIPRQLKHKGKLIDEIVMIKKL